MNARTIPDLADAEPLTYYHVLCFQDFGGSQEYAVGWDRKLTAAEALDLAKDAVEADLPKCIGWYHPDFPEETNWNAGGQVQAEVRRRVDRADVI